MGHFAVAGGHAVQHQRPELLAPSRVFGKIMHRQRAADALPQQHDRLALDLRRLVEPGEGGLDILVDRRQAGRAFGAAIATVIQ
ncbi:hypothetical protein D3C84_1161810 [compost metagenome]